MSVEHGNLMYADRLYLKRLIKTDHEVTYTLCIYYIMHTIDINNHGHYAQYRHTVDDHGH